MLGRLHYLGKVGIGPDYKVAATWFQKVINSESEYTRAKLSSLYQIGVMKEYGLGMSVDFAGAAKLYEEASQMVRIHFISHAASLIILLFSPYFFVVSELRGSYLQPGTVVCIRQRSPSGSCSCTESFRSCTYECIISHTIHMHGYIIVNERGNAV